MSLCHYLNCHVFKQKFLKMRGSPDPERERGERECVSTKCPVSYVTDALIVNFCFANRDAQLGICMIGFQI